MCDGQVLAVGFVMFPGTSAPRYCPSCALQIANRHRRICGCGQAGHAGKTGGLHSSMAQETEAEVERLIGEGMVEDFQAVEIDVRRIP